MRSLIFVSNALDDKTRLERGIVTDSPAASRKVFLVSKALRRAGVRASVLSLGRGRQDGSGRYFGAKVLRVENVPVIYLPFFNVPVISELASLFFSVPILWRLSRRPGNKTALFYNRMPAYTLALVTAKLLRFRTVLDLEDGETNLNGRSWSSLRSRFLRWMFDSLCPSGALLACEALTQNTRIRPIQCCYGTIEAVPRKANPHSPMVTVLLGGTVSRNTGAGMLIDAIKLLRAEAPLWAQRLTFEITGKGDSLNDLEALASCTQEPAVIVHGRTTDNDYCRILERTSVGLALKPVAGKFADTTFPSKVIEFVSQGILVVTTDISDVRKVLADGALYLTHDDPRHLIEKLKWIVENPSAADDLTRKAVQAVATVCSPGAVGPRLADFLFASTVGG